MQSQLEGQQIGRYLLRQPLGGGGVATVYRAHDQVSGQEVALKLLPPNPDPAMLNRFRREAMYASALRHPHIIRILQVGTTENTPAAYIAMDLITGESLAALLARVGKLGAVESCLLLEPVARALAFAHEQSVIHRDVKPANILLRQLEVTHEEALSAGSITLDAYDSPVVPVLSDFGIARLLDAPELTRDGRTVGTPAFMAPEQCMGSRAVDGRADIYALGAVLYRCVTGHLPFTGTTTQIMHAHVFEPVVIDDEIAHQLPPKVLEILRRALAKEPDARYQSAQTLAADLASVATSPVAMVGAAAADATSTMTATQIVATPIATPRAQKVLVTGSTEQSPVGEPIASRQPARSKSGARRGPSLDRLLWAIFFVILIGGGGWWSIQSWLRARTVQNNVPSSLPALVFLTYTPTPTSQSMPADQLVATPMVPSAAGSVAETAPTVTTAPAAALPTSTPLSTSPPIPTPLPTPVPTLIPPTKPIVAPPVAQPAPRDDGSGVGGATPTAVVAEEEVAGTCAMVVDEFFLAAIAQLREESQHDFACPTEPARSVAAEWMPFAHGMMVALAGEPWIYVYYESGAWEQVARAESGDPPATNEDAVAQPDLPLPFAPVWASEGRHVVLGEPLQSEPWRGDTVVQPFMGGVALGNGGNGQMLFLARAKLRF